jgi:hypothetical protein
MFEKMFESRMFFGDKLSAVRSAPGDRGRPEPAPGAR